MQKNSIKLIKRTCFAFLATVVLISCGKENKTEEKIAEVEVADVHIERFDKVFYESGAGKLPEMKKKFPFLFPASDPDSVWINKMNHPMYRELYSEVQKQFPDNSKLQSGLTDFFRHAKYYFPEFTQPRVITLISEMDYNNRVVYTDSLLLISLDLYLGKEHRYYADDFYDYQRQNLVPEQILPDVAAAFSHKKIANPNDRTLLSLMVYFGKELYLKDLMLPGATDAEKMGYTPDEEAWARENESEIWRYFVENNLLFDTDMKLPSRFINPAPFSKFYLELDNESPGRVGQWIGWQIVKAYANNNKDVTLHEILAMDAKTLFDNSKYKPKK